MGVTVLWLQFGEREIRYQGCLYCLNKTQKINKRLLKWEGLATLINPPPLDSPLPRHVLSPLPVPLHKIPVSTLAQQHEF